MEAQYFLAAVLVLVVIVVLILLFTVFSVRGTVSNAQDAAETLRQLEADIEALIDQYDNVTFDDISEFFSAYYQGICFFLSGTYCLAGGASYDRDRCTPLCEMILSTKQICDRNPSLQNTRICLALASIPDPIVPTMR